MDAGKGGTIIVSDTLTSLDGQGIEMWNGGIIQRADGSNALPAFKSITNGYLLLYDTSFDFSGVEDIAGTYMWLSDAAQLDLSGVPSITVGKDYEQSASIQAGNDTSIDLSSVTSIELYTDGHFNVQAYDRGSVDLSGLQEISDAEWGSSMTAFRDGHVDMSSLTTVTRGDVGADNGGTMKVGRPGLTTTFDDWSYVTSYSGGLVEGGEFILLNQSRLTGSSTIVADVVNRSAVVRPGSFPGTDGAEATLTLQGDYIQEAGGTLELSISNKGSALFDLFDVSGDVHLDGLLDLTVTESATFELEPEMEFLSLTANSLTGMFAGLDQGDVAWSETGGDGDLLYINYLPNGVLFTTTFVPEPGTFTLLASGLAAAGFGVWRRRKRRGDSRRLG